MWNSIGKSDSQPKPKPNRNRNRNRNPDPTGVPYKDTIRAFLLHFHHTTLQRAESKFDFSNGSVGNFFFAGSRMFFHSFDAALFLYLRVSGIQPGCSVLPIIQVDSESRIRLGVKSTQTPHPPVHPSTRPINPSSVPVQFHHPRTSINPLTHLQLPKKNKTKGAELKNGTILYGQSEISHPNAVKQDTLVNKAQKVALPSPIKRVFYLAEEGKW